jgi:hypothetical protein
MEKSMRLDSSVRGQRNDFEQFSKFLGLGTQRQTRNEIPANPCENDRVPYKSLAMVYSPVQEYRMIYDPEIALVNGTIFEELDKPFYCGSCRGKSSGKEGCL